ncbi:MAG: DNA-processing protein DprA [Bacteroidota bacterium]|nr:DNA-processing protein DprA [Bacteroidota bacterium]
MHRDPDVEAILLLNVPFGQGSAEFRPLTPGQYREFAQWLYARNLSPADLLGDERDRILSDWDHNAVLENARIKKPTREHIEHLLGRGFEMGLVMGDWESAGLWALTRADQDYPRHLRRRLGRNSPPVLFGCGEKGWLSQPAVAVVGSRDASPEDLEFCRNFGAHVSREGAVLVSGAAKGVDRNAMSGAMKAGGFAVGVMAEGLLRKSSSPKDRLWIQEGHLTLVSQFPPEARWRGHQAMIRNKLIYCLSDAALVVASADGSKLSKGKSGTWTGATENIRNKWVPLWVKRTHDDKSGNAALVRKGGQWLPEPFPALNELMALQTQGRPQEQLAVQFDEQYAPPEKVIDEKSTRAAHRLLPILKGEMSREEIREAIELKSWSGINRRYVAPCLEQGWIEMTNPDVPRSPKQRFRLTQSGEKWLISKGM